MLYLSTLLIEHKDVETFDEFLDIPIWFGMSEKQVNTVASEILSVIN